MLGRTDELKLRVFVLHEKKYFDFWIKIPKFAFKFVTFLCKTLQEMTNIKADFMKRYNET